MIYLHKYLLSASFKGKGGYSSLSNFKIFIIFSEKKHVLYFFIIIPKIIILCTGKWELVNIITMINYLFIIEILEYIIHLVQGNNTPEPDKNRFFCSVAIPWTIQLSICIYIINKFPKKESSLYILMTKQYTMTILMFNLIQKLFFSEKALSLYALMALTQSIDNNRIRIYDFIKSKN